MRNQSNTQISSKYISWKQFLAGNGYTAIFAKAGFDKQILGNKRIQTVASRGIRIYEYSGKLRLINK